MTSINSFLRNNVRNASEKKVSVAPNIPESKLNEGGNVSIKDMIDCDYLQLAKLLQSCAVDFDNFREERQLIPVEEMSDALKVSYVKTIINMAFSDDGVVDEKEFAEVLMLMTRLNLSADARFELRTYLSSVGSLASVENLMATINAECPEGQIGPVHVSLAKDLINTHLSTGGSSLADFRFFADNRHLLNVSDGELELIIMAIETDYKMLKSEYSDDYLVKAIKSMSAKAAAVGTPLAAVYLSGSVVGLSAAGITSGLATLGMGGILGLSGMASGIGVAVLIGLGTYTGVRKLTGADEMTKSRRRELMLNEVIKKTQLTIALLVQDINFVVTKLNAVMVTTDRHEAQIRKLVDRMQQMTSAGDILVGMADSARSSAARIRCPGVLNVTRLHSLTRDPTKIPLYDFIFGFYEERTEVSEKDGSEAHIAVLRQDCDARNLEKLVNAFDAIGYFDAAEVAKGAALGVAMKAKDKLAGQFS